jgi:hypothetical protein
MAKLPKFEMDRPCQRLVNEVYEAAARWSGEYSVTVTRVNRKRKYLGMSEIGNPCSRALWFGFRGFFPLPKDGRMDMIFELGDHIEQIQIHWLELAGFEITDRQIEFTDHAGHFRGHPDGILHGLTRRPHVWDGKSINKKNMEALQKFGARKTKPIYYCQAQMMMHYAGLDRAVFTFMCKDNSQWYAERFYYNETEARALVQKSHSIITANEIPERPFKDDSFECGTYLDMHRCFCLVDELKIQRNLVELFFALPLIQM